MSYWVLLHGVADTGTTPIEAKMAIEQSEIKAFNGSPSVTTGGRNVLSPWPNFRKAPANEEPSCSPREEKRRTPLQECREHYKGFNLLILLHYYRESAIQQTA